MKYASNSAIACGFVACVIGTPVKGRGDTTKAEGARAVVRLKY